MNDPAWRRTEKFVRDLSWVSVLFLAARAASALLHVAAGRRLGPAQYGDVHLALSVSDGLALLAAGLAPALIRQAGAGGQALSESASAAFAVFAGACALLWGSVSFWGPALAEGLRLPPALPYWALGHATCAGLFVLCGAVLLAGARFRARGLAEALYQTAALAAFALWTSRGGRGYGSLVGCLCLAFLLAAGFCVFFWPGMRARRPGPGFSAEFLRYLGWACLNAALAVVVLAAPRILLNYHRGGAAVGLYGAYFTATVLVAVAGSGIVSTVLFASSRSPEAQAWAWERLPRTGLALALPAYLALLVCGRLGLTFFGSGYPFRGTWLVLAAAAALAFFIKELPAQLMAARDIRGLRAACGGNLAGAVAALAVGPGAVARWGVAGALLCLCLALCASLLAYALWYRRAILGRLQSEAAPGGMSVPISDEPR
ncbi:MAG: hypothetical protein PHF00_06775 [Elusimicrobia bacterium]|nr:hypothetical protein [Elusimicrobiota bacterium]